MIVAEVLNSKYFVKPIGEFEQESPKMVVSDPSVRDLEATTVIEVKPGLWRSYVIVDTSSDTDSNIGMIVQHEDLPKRGVRRLLGEKWELIASNQPIMSSMVGVFDKAHYHDQSLVIELNKELRQQVFGKSSWYHLSVDAVHNRKNVGVIPFGSIVSPDLNNKYSILGIKQNAKCISVGVDIKMLNENIKSSLFNHVT